MSIKMWLKHKTSRIWSYFALTNILLGIKWKQFKVNYIKVEIMIFIKGMLLMKVLILELTFIKMSKVTKINKVNKIKKINKHNKINKIKLTLNSIKIK